ncbi:MAG TPA: D-alanine--poly(phosphoribitol) ligase subunit DltC [Chloroflexota bacterium]|jgi:D-alanine--poly(phosphoribitol) ligase subunit 2|nr:D-alanine--poly(phosphoribitol) ligase subunit DltC [Chloroflexota bacterium]
MALDLRAAVTERVLRVLRDATGSDEVLTDWDVPLYESGLLDSLGMVTLIVALGEEFGLSVSPAEFDREAWSTPRKVANDVEERLARQ